MFNWVVGCIWGGCESCLWIVEMGGSCVKCL